MFDLATLGGAVVTGYVTDQVTEAFIDFTYRGHTFCANNQQEEWWFFVDDPACPGEILVEVVRHCAKHLAPRLIRRRANAGA